MKPLAPRETNYLIPKRDNTKPGNQFLETMSQESAIYTLEQKWWASDAPPSRKNADNSGMLFLCQWI